MALVNQYKKKAVLFRTNHLLVPMGNDFRFTTEDETRKQFDNHKRIFDYINSQPNLHVKVLHWRVFEIHSRTFLDRQ